MRVTVSFSPASVDLAAPCAVIVDVLRATTTLTVAFSNGAREVLPVATPAEALALRAKRADVLVCGEREGRKVAGFDLGNSPFEYAEDVVRGRTLAFASTNGSLAMLAVRRARRRVLGAFVNAEAVVESVRREAHVTIVCAGRLGGFSLEDAACAGWLLVRLESHGAVADGASARSARTLAPRDAAEVRTMVESAAHARDLMALGGAYARDLELCARLDAIHHAWELDARGA